MPCKCYKIPGPPYRPATPRPVANMPKDGWWDRLYKMVDYWSPPRGEAFPGTSVLDYWREHDHVDRALEFIFWWMKYNPVLPHENPFIDALEGPTEAFLKEIDTAFDGYIDERCSEEYDLPEEFPGFGIRY